MIGSRDCRLIRGGNYAGRQGLTLSAGIRAESAGSTALCLHTLIIPPGGRARAHRHNAHESAIYLVSGVVDVFWGDGLKHHDVMQAGDFLYIPPGVAHLPVNNGPDPADVVVARTDPSEQESVELLPELDAMTSPGHVPANSTAGR